MQPRLRSGLFFSWGRMKEATLIRYITGKLPPTVHSQSMTFGSRSFNGTPDRYFDGPVSDLWVEFKYVDAMPRSGKVGGVSDAKRGCYSTLQYEWMCRRFANGGNVLGIVGLPDRTAVIQIDPAQWLDGSSIQTALPWLEVARRIEHFCTGGISEKQAVRVGSGTSSGRPADQRGIGLRRVAKRPQVRRK